jgi:hypothetical protein
MRAHLKLKHQTKWSQYKKMLLQLCRKKRNARDSLTNNSVSALKKATAEMQSRTKENATEEASRDNGLDHKAPNS